MIDHDHPVAEEAGIVVGLFRRQHVVVFHRDRLAITGVFEREEPVEHHAMLPSERQAGEPKATTGAKYRFAAETTGPGSGDQRTRDAADRRATIGAAAKVRAATNIGMTTEVSAATNIGMTTEVRPATNVGATAEVRATANVGAAAKFAAGAHVGAARGVALSATVLARPAIGVAAGRLAARSAVRCAPV